MFCKCLPTNLQKYSVPTLELDAIPNDTSKSFMHIALVVFLFVYKIHIYSLIRGFLCRLWQFQL